MFKDSNITRMDAWSLVEESDSIPDAAFPAFIGSGKIGVALDAAGLQSLPDRLCERYHSTMAPWHATQADLYLFRDGMISEHLWQDEIAHANFDPDDPSIANTAHRNLMPLGYLAQSLTFGGQTYAGDDIRKIAGHWRRDWSLKDGVVRTDYGILHKQNPPPMSLSFEAFTPHGSESLFIHLERSAHGTLTGSCKWTIRLALETRHGLPIYDSDSRLEVGHNTIIARIERESTGKPLEDYVVVYGVGAEGASIDLGPNGIAMTLVGKLQDASSAWIRLDMRRLAGEERISAAGMALDLANDLVGFGKQQYEAARREHDAEMTGFWSRTADIEVDGGDEFETRRRFMLHMSEYLLRCGNDWGMGGSAQFLFMHQNGWQAGNFHDHHYIVDGIARAGMFREALDHVQWLRKVMRHEGRVFPWIINYDGTAPLPPERDRAPMSDANRAMLAVRIYELAGSGRATLLESTVYPIVAAVADQALEWFERVGDGYVLKGVEMDVMDDDATVNEVGTVIIFEAVVRKAVAYAEHLHTDEHRRARWRNLAEHITYDTKDGKYLAHRGASTSARTSPWFANGLYLGEASHFLDVEMYRRTLEYEPPTTICNYAWLNSATASSWLRLGRPDRAEQLMVDTLENTIHGPGYFEEMSPIGLYGLPPLVTAHGSYVTAACEQIVLANLWQPALAIGTGIPSRLRAKTIRFHSLRTIRGLTIEGVAKPRNMSVVLTPSGERVSLPVTLAIPACAGSRFRVELNGEPTNYTFGGESVTVDVEIIDQPVRLVVRD